MIRIENIDTYGWEAAIRGMRNPMNSWNKSDSGFKLSIGIKDIQVNHEGDYDYAIGPEDAKLMKNLVAAGTDHAKFLRQIGVSMDITAPLYWWKEFDTYKVGTTANSCSTMHKITERKFTIYDFSHDHLFNEIEDDICVPMDSMKLLQLTVKVLNGYREAYLRAKIQPYKNLEARADRMKRIWWQMIQLLPSSYNQKRTVTLNYAVLRNQYHARKNHKLDEWRDYCECIKAQLPYSELITMCYTEELSSWKKTTINTDAMFSIARKVIARKNMEEKNNG